jgi:hypothetical protein
MNPAAIAPVEQRGLWAQFSARGKEALPEEQENLVCAPCKR